MAAQPFTVALAGNPNVGKSTLFNALTGGRQHVGNWPGKTVEKKEGRLRLGGQDVVIVDLPGTYSLAAYSVEEIIARDFIVDARPQVVVAVTDSANLERNLYLVTQLLELEVPLILALNMSDAAASQGLRLDYRALSNALGGIPVVETVGSRGAGVEALKNAIARMADQASGGAPVQPDYGPAIEAELSALQTRIAAETGLTGHYPPRWLALKLLENDAAVSERLEALGAGALVAFARGRVAELTHTLGDEPEIIIADQRYAFIGQVVRTAVCRTRTLAEPHSERIDRVLTHRVWGLPIFLMLMWLVFQFTANVSAPYVDWIDSVLSGPVSRWVGGLFVALGLSGTWLESLALDGVIAGVGGVLAFVPVLMFLYFAIALLEDSGYMARAAFVMDRVMRLIGLHGKSFLPLLIGFGCTVPAVYATRTLEHENDRKLTAFLATFMSCGARLPVYALFGAAFFGTGAGTLVFGLYLSGIGVALLTGLVAKRTLYRSQPPPPFVMELPPYRLPNAYSVWTQMWERTSGFVRKAATVIVGCAILVWLLLAVPTDGSAFAAVDPAHSLFGTVSRVAAPVFAPAGFGTWEASGALVTGLIAKEVVIGTLIQVYAVPAQAASAESEPETTPTLGEDLGGIVTSFGEAAALTVQEIVNIVPRTVNVLSGAAVPEADWLGAGEAAEDTGALATALRNGFTPLAAVAFNVFVLLYMPCMAATAALRNEFGRRWMLYQVVYTLVIAWAGAVLVYQVGRLLGLGV